MFRLIVAWALLIYRQGKKTVALVTTFSLRSLHGIRWNKSYWLHMRNTCIWHCPERDCNALHLKTKNSTRRIVWSCCRKLPRYSCSAADFLSILWKSHFLSVPHCWTCTVENDQCAPQHSYQFKFIHICDHGYGTHLMYAAM